MTVPLKHGVFRTGGRRFWGFAKGKEYWVSEKTFERLTKGALAAKRRRYAKDPEKYKKIATRYRRQMSTAQRERVRQLDRQRRLTPSRVKWTRAWRKAYAAKNPSFAISARLRVRVANALARCGTTKASSTAELLGCSWKDFLAHLEKQFLPGMSWANRNRWHLDHIKPCCAFDLTCPQEQRRCFHYSNLRPLWARENLTKSSSY